MQHLHTKCSPEAHSLSSLLTLNHSPWRVGHLVLHAKSLQSCPTLCNPMDYSLPGSTIHGILQERILELIAMPFSRWSSQPWLKPMSLMSWAMAGGFLTTSATWQKGVSVPPFSNPVLPHPCPVFFQPHPDLLPAFTGAFSLHLASSWQWSWTCYKATWSWHAAVHGVAKSWAQLSDWTTLWQKKRGGRRGGS